jgi:hypothetical protein
MTIDRGFPIDWNEWHEQWRNWRTAYGLKNAHHYPFPGKNFLADEVLGVYNVRGRTVELSEVTFPNLSERDAKTGRLIERRNRFVGVTWFDNGECVSGGLAESFSQLEAILKGEVTT